jgi:hypothetical protein
VCVCVSRSREGKSVCVCVARFREEKRCEAHTIGGVRRCEAKTHSIGVRRREAKTHSIGGVYTSYRGGERLTLYRRCPV